MAKSKGIVWLAGVAICCGSLGMAKAGEDRDARLIAEAKLLFRTVLADEKPPEHCELDPKWDTYHPIPESVAREHFGMKLHAELTMTAPVFVERLNDILDLADDGEPICSNEDVRSIESERLKQYESSGEDYSLSTRRTTYSFPVFSDDYKSAALVVSHSLYSHSRTAGRTMRLPLVQVGYAAIYKKIKGAWRRITTIELFIS